MYKDEEDNTHYGKISRRGLGLLLAQAAGITALGARAKFLQIDENDRYFLMAEDNRIATILEPAPRGIIYDSEGVKIADNIPNFRVEMRLEHTDDAKRVLELLGQLMELPAPRQAEILDKINKSNGVGSLAIADHMSWSEFSIVNENLPVLPGVQTRIAQSRVYPCHEILCHQIGYVRRVSKKDLENMETIHPIYLTPNMVIGKAGIEAKIEEQLRGTEGRRDLEQNAHQHVIREIDYQPGIAGDEVQTTLSADLHHYANERMRGEGAAAVIMDVENGDIKLLASSPGYDPNPFVFGITQAQYDELLNNPLRPLPHKAVAGQYPPGSTFKMVTALAALEQGVVHPNEWITCRGKIKRGRNFHCWKRGGHGGVNLKNSLKHSCDVYYYTIAERAGIDNIASVAQRLGLGQRYDIPQTSIYPGLIPTKAWKLENRNEDWVVGDSFNAGIGQGFVLATPLQLAVMTARIASGKAVFPNLIHSVNGVQQERRVEELDINPDHLRMIKEGMYAVVNENRGTAYKARIQADGALWAGKTGTSQVRNISKAERERGVIRNEDLERTKRDHALFVAYAPVDKPKYAIAVVVEHGGSGSGAAAPLARDLMLHAMYNGKPPLSAYPSAARGAAREFMASVPPLESIIRNPLAEELEEEVSKAASDNSA